MNKVVNVNISGKAFTIDEDAYTELSRYLKSLEKHFSHSMGSEEILYDIENRISELLSEDSAKGIIISKEKIKQVKSVMGMPKDFEEADRNSNYTGTSEQHHSTTARKRLFRDPNNKVIGGVCSGLAAYFGIDTLLARALFLFMFVGFGVGLFLYIILWIFIPKAVTRSDFLSMKGEDINIDNISRKVEDGFREIKGTIEDLGKDIKEKVL